jgi:hypothetical protein
MLYGASQSYPGQEQCGLSDLTARTLANLNIKGSLEEDGAVGKSAFVRLSCLRS